MGWPKGRISTAIILVLAGLIIATAALVVIVLVATPRSARIVDCAPGFHNVSGPASDCVPNTPGTPTNP